MKWLARPQAQVAGVRSMTVVPIVAAASEWHDGRGAGSTARGNVYCVDKTGTARCQIQDVRISNSLCMSPDGALLYFADSPTRTINAYEPRRARRHPRPSARIRPHARRVCARWRDRGRGWLCLERALGWCVRGAVHA